MLVGIFHSGHTGQVRASGTSERLERACIVWHQHQRVHHTGQVQLLEVKVSRLNHCQHLFSLKLKDSYEFVWHVEQQEVFDQIKDVANPPILMLSIQGRPLKLYISTAEESSGCLLAQDTKDDTERAVYYLSMLLNDVKTI